VSARASEALLRELPLFAQLDETSELYEILAFAAPFSLQAGALLFRQGDESDGMYVVAHGEIIVSARVPGDTEAELGRVGPGGILGELALLDRGFRSATAQARVPTTGFFFSEQFFKMLRLAQRVSALKVMQPICRVISQRVRDRVADLAACAAPGGYTATLAHVEGMLTSVIERPAEWPEHQRQSIDDLVAEHLHVMPFFYRFTIKEVRELLRHGRLLDVQRGQLLWRRGERSARSYIVMRGAVRLSVQRQGLGELCMVLGPGQLVGAVSLMDGGPQPMDCVAREPSWLWETDVETLQGVLGGAQGISYKLFDAVVESLVDQLRRVTRAVARVAAQGRIVARDAAQTSISTVVTNP
jgi:CRP/FNR family cyclic AMP-dependent transcriptional regulator